MLWWVGGSVAPMLLSFPDWDLLPVITPEEV